MRCPLLALISAVALFMGTSTTNGPSPDPVVTSSPSSVTEPSPVPPTAPVTEPWPAARGALVGGYLGAPTEHPDQRFHEFFGDWPDLASSYYQAQDRGGGVLNLAYEQVRIDRGTIPVLTVTSTDGPYTMREIGSGTADQWIDSWATDLSELDGEVWFSFDHEFEVKLNQGKFSAETSLDDYVSAYNRFQQRVRAQAPNVKFMYWYGYSDREKIDHIGAGIDRPDIIALDPYVFSHHDPTTSFEEMAEPKLDWLLDRSWYDDQPIIFAEFAKDTRHGDDNVADFLTDLRPRMDAIGVAGAIYFSRDKSGDIEADLTTGNWPLATLALESAVS